MTSSRWQNVKEIAAQAVKLEPSERARFLDKACSDAETRDEVESLLDFETDGFLETPLLGGFDEPGETDSPKMTLGPGSRLGSYEILTPLGVGGMGEVYRARDDTLGREVAIKILPEEFSRVEERLERFEREARVLASLNHPGIATLHGLEKHDGLHYLVMELVAGETLEAKIDNGAIPFDEALPLLHQMAEALEVAHDKGVIHRDLKPANVMVTAEGHVKILDFGLAKDLLGPTTASADSHSPTLQKDGTREGVILGTAGYMSPEQARGKPVDKRADVWAFACVSYEVLTGRPAFPGEVFTDILASVLHSEPDWNALPKSAPTKVRELLQRCLRKDPHRRMRDVGDARLELEEVTSASAEISTAAPSKRTNLNVAAIVALTAIVTAFTVWGVLRRDVVSPGNVTRAVIPFSPDEELALRVTSAVALSPDGRCIAYAVTRAGASELFMRMLNEPDSKLVARADRSRDVAWMPFFSPDSQWLGFLEQGLLKKVAVSGGAPVTIATIGEAHGASWGPGATIVFAPESTHGLSRVSAEGGTIEVLTLPNREQREKAHRLPEVLPSGNAVVFTRASADIVSWEDADIAVMSLETGDYQIVVEGGTNARYSETGHLVYARSGSVYAVPFDVRALQVTGPPVRVLDGVAMWTSSGNAEFSLSRSGTLVYAPGDARAEAHRVVRVDRSGHSETLIDAERPFSEVRSSPNGKMLALEMGGANHGLWVYDIARTTMTRLALGFDNGAAVWTPDGERVTFASNRSGRTNLYWQSADGSESAERLTTSEYAQTPGCWSPNGTTLVFEEYHPETGWDLWSLSNDRDRAPRPILQTPASERRAAFSADGRFLAYESDASGRVEVYIGMFPSLDAKRRVSSNGGRFPVWSVDGSELFYRNGDEVLVVNVETSGKLAVSAPKLLYEKRFVSGALQLLPDGESFVGLDDADATTDHGPKQLNLVLNWSRELQELMTP